MKNETMYREFLQLVTTDSAAGREGAIAAILMEKLRELGFQVMTDDAGERFPGECGNVFGVLEGQLDGALLLSSHMDRVPNGLGIRPVERDGVLYSDGTTILAADDISGVCAILDGIRQAKASGRPLPRIEVLFTVQEETTLGGSKSIDMELIQSKLGFFFDSAGPVGRFINGAPGLYDLTVEITGRSAHAGNEPEKGVNAAKILCDMLAGLPQGRLDPISTCNFPVISTGSKANNVVCDSASFQGEYRSRDYQRLLDYIDHFESHCRKVAEDNGAGIRIEKVENFLPFHVAETDEALVIGRKACEKLGIRYFAELGGGGMDANIIYARGRDRGMQCVGVASGCYKNHTLEEHLVLDDFYRSGQLCAAIIEVYGETCRKK